MSTGRLHCSSRSQSKNVKEREKLYTYLNLARENDGDSDTSNNQNPYNNLEEYEKYWKTLNFREEMRSAESLQCLDLPEYLANWGDLMSIRLQWKHHLLLTWKAHVTIMIKIIM